MRIILDEASENCCLRMQKTGKRKEWITPVSWQHIEGRCLSIKKKINARWSAGALQEKYGKSTHKSIGGSRERSELTRWLMLKSWQSTFVSCGSSAKRKAEEHLQYWPVGNTVVTRMPPYETSRGTSSPPRKTRMHQKRSL